ncbi:MAG TPA: dienelactone hydrolase family protein [Caulobacteraceae bacterium]|nr:dienelactone hydrolase family protein [Caulobacteraceae bacterium]
MAGWIRVAVLALVLGLAAAGGVRAQERIAIPSETPPLLGAYLHQKAPPTTVVGYLYMPANATGPAPALILKHSSGGLTGADGENVRAWAKTLNGWGVAAFAVDSFGPRGVGSTVSDQSQLPQWADLADSFNALKVLAADPRIDKSRIGIMGWSRGGTIAMLTALEAARRAVIDADGPKFAAHIVFYGSASTQFRDTATDGAPMLFLHGSADDYVAVGPTKEFADWAQSMGDPVTFITYPGAYHEFDVAGGFNGYAAAVQSGRNCDAVIDLSTGQVVRMDHKPANGVTVAAYGAYFKSCIQSGADLHYNAQARADAVQQVHAFLQRVFHIAG